MCEDANVEVGVNRRTEKKGIHEASLVTWRRRQSATYDNINGCVVLQHHQPRCVLVFFVDCDVHEVSLQLLSGLVFCPHVTVRMQCSNPAP